MAVNELDEMANPREVQGFFLVLNGGQDGDEVTFYEKLDDLLLRVNDAVRLYDTSLNDYQVIEGRLRKLEVVTTVTHVDLKK